MDSVEEEGEFDNFGRAEVVLDPDGGDEGVGGKDGAAAMDDFDVHHTGEGLVCPIIPLRVKLHDIFQRPVAVAGIVPK